MTQEMAITEAFRSWIMLGTAMLITVASARARKMPGARASSTSHGARPEPRCARAGSAAAGWYGTVWVVGRSVPGPVGSTGTPQGVPTRRPLCVRRKEPRQTACLRRAAYVRRKRIGHKADPRHLAELDRLARSSWPSRGTTSACRWAPTRADVQRLLVALDVRRRRPGAGACARAAGILTHHPLIFSPLERHRGRHPGPSSLRATREGLAVIVAHTNLDKAGAVWPSWWRHAGPGGHAAAAAVTGRLAQARRLRAAGRRRPGAQGAVRGRRRRDR